MTKNICVFCSSSDAVESIYKKQTIKLGEQIAQSNHKLLYGGANVGLMNLLFQTVKDNNGKAMGVIPQKIVDFGLACNEVDELIITEDMHSRKAKLEQLADAFIALPGGFGTLEELSEVITLKQLGYFNKPIVILNIDHFYDKLIDFYEQLYELNFAKAAYKKLYFITDTVEDAMHHIESYEKKIFENKWYT